MDLTSISIADAVEIARLVQPPATELTAIPCTAEAALETEPPTLRIAILQRGWVVVGLYQRTGMTVTLTDARVVRRWGTTRGLGQLAAEGPQPNTVLDPAGTVRCHALSVVATLDCEPQAWK